MPEETGQSRQAIDAVIFDMAISVAKIEEHIKSVDEQVNRIDLKCIDLNGYKQRIKACEETVEKHDKTFRNTAYVLIVVVLLGGIGFFAAEIYKHITGG